MRGIAPARRCLAPRSGRNAVTPLPHMLWRSPPFARGELFRFFPSWDPRTRRNNLLDGLTVGRTGGPSGHTNSPYPSSREGYPSTARWISGFLLSGLILNVFHAAAAACCRVQRNSVPSTQMRCMMTANRRAKATIAFFIPRRYADAPKTCVCSKRGTLRPARGVQYGEVFLEEEIAPTTTPITRNRRLYAPRDRNRTKGWGSRHS